MPTNVQERERGSANADGGAGADGGTGADGSTNASCRNGNVGGGFKQKQQNKTRSNKKRPHQTMQASRFNDGVGGGI